MKSLMGALAIAAVLSSYSAYADNSITARLEQGDVISNKVGDAVTFQTLVNLDPAKGATAFEDLSVLPKLLPSVAFVRTYVTPDHKKLAYLKLRGIGDGVSILVEVKGGADTSFSNARELIISAQQSPLRDTAAEVDLDKDGSQIELLKEVDATNKTADATRSVSLTKNLIIEGPLNEVFEFPTTRFIINLGVGSYSVIGNKPGVKSTTSTYLVAKMSVGSQVSHGEIGDIAGFSQRRINLVQRFGQETFLSIKKAFGPSGELK